MPLSRRHLLSLPAAATLAGLSAQAVAATPQSTVGAGGFGDWQSVRDLFQLSPDKAHLSAMLISAHPAPVRDAIERHRRGLDADPVEYLEANDERLTGAARRAAATYLGLHESHVALTDSTTMSVGLVYAGVRLRAGDEIITTEQDYFVTDEALRLAAARAGAVVRKVSLYDRIEDAGVEAMVSAVIDAITPATRLVALTWVHSSTGLKIPAARIGARIREINAERAEADRVLFGLDAVHGFGIENVSLAALGCDFLMAGCHKWLFGPRGTGIIAASDRGLRSIAPLIPSFDDPNVMARWIEDRSEPAGVMTGTRLTPGGFKPFEHRWALTEAFALHDRIGRDAVEQRTHALATRLKAELKAVPGVSVKTPDTPDLSAGIVSFDVEGSAPAQVVARLRQRGVIGSVAPYARPHVRLTPSIVNSEADLERAVSALSEIV